MRRRGVHDHVVAVAREADGDGVVSALHVVDRVVGQHLHHHAVHQRHQPQEQRPRRALPVTDDRVSQREQKAQADRKGGHAA